MNLNFHEGFQRMVDESLAGAISAEKEQSLREHLSACVLCQEYLSASNRVISGLSGFSFEVNPALNTQVLSALRLQAQKVPSAQPRRLQFLHRHIVEFKEFKVWAAFAVALLLSIAGSAFVYKVATLLLHFDTAQVRTDVLVFWLLPSFCATLCLLATPGEKRGIA